MDLGDLIFFVIFIIIVVSNILKQVKKTRKPPEATPEGPKTGWKKTFEDILKDIRTQMEQNAKPDGGKPGRPPLTWEDLILVEPEKKQSTKQQTQPKAAVMIPPEPAPKAPGRESDFDDLRGQGREGSEGNWEKEQAREKRPPRKIKKSLPELSAVGGLTEETLTDDDLANAVVWHEILSPPLGLRNF